MSQAISLETSERLSAGVEELSVFRDGVRPGWSREVFSEPYRASRDWTAARMCEVGLEVTVDSAGNIVGRLAGRNSSAPALVTGSHTDTVDGGGRFDGIVGVLGSIEAARLVQESGTQLQRDLLVVDFLGEESNVFGLSCLGSRSAAQEMTREDLDRQDYRGVTLGQAYSDFGLDPSMLAEVPWASARCTPSSNCTSNRARPSRSTGCRSASSRPSPASSASSPRSPAPRIMRGRRRWMTAGTR
ncbi:M28 family peptidase [Vibrio cholerae]|nr:M28 family peptidase [Vibrio cholerae]